MIIDCFIRKLVRHTWLLISLLPSIVHQLQDQGRGGTIDVRPDISERAVGVTLAKLATS